MTPARVRFDGVKIVREGQTVIVLKHDRPVFHVRQVEGAWHVFHPESNQVVFESLRISGTVRWVKQQFLEGMVR